MNFCPHCGGKITSPEARFCMNCGKSLESFKNQKFSEATGHEYSIDAKSKGTVNKICTNAGAIVNRGDVLLTITNYFSGEEETISADANAVVKNFAVKVGQTVKPNDTLVVLASSSTDVEVLPPVQDDNFFGEFSEAADNAPVNPSSSDGDFFDELGTAVNQELSEGVAIIQEAENYFMNGDFQQVENLLQNFVGKGIDRVNYMLALIYESGGNGIMPNNSAAIDIIGNSKGDLPLLHMFNSFWNESTTRYNEVNESIWKELPNLEKTDDIFMKTEIGIYLGKTRGQMKKSIKYLEEAEQQGYWLASIMLGVFYQDGGVNGKENYRDAAEHYLLAEKKGIPIASKGLGLILKLGLGNFETNYKLAKEYLLNAANYLQDEVSIFHLADIYSEEGNLREAIKWFDKNVSVNDEPTSASRLGLILLNINEDSRINADYQRAYELFQFANSRNADDTLALFGLGWSYVVGAAVAANEDSARYYFNQAVQKGYNTPGGQLARKALESLNQPPQNQNSGCFITTAVCDTFGKSDDCYELTTFRKFRDEWLTVQPDGRSLILEYYEIAPRIVANINRLSEAKKIYKNIWKQYLAPCLNFINCGDNFSCKQKYIDMVHELKKLYL